MIKQFHFLYLSEDNENTNSKRYMHPHIQQSIIYNSQDMETTQMSMNDVE